MGSVTTGANKWGTPLKTDNSTFFGSTKSNLTSSGLARIKILAKIQLIQTDLPDPVAPATNKWGVLLISQYFGLLKISLPRATNNLLSDFSWTNFSMISLTKTVVGFSLDISIPTVLLPGIGAWIRTSFLASAKLISLLIPVSFDNLVPGFNSSSYWVIAGPTVTSTTCPIIPNSLNTSSSFWIFDSILAWLLFFIFLGSSKRDKGGNL